MFYDPATIARYALLFFVLPLWMGAGLADYLLHRQSRIEVTSGAKESFLHLVQLLEAGVPVLLALWFEINSLLILLMLIGFALHEVTALCDVRYAISRRYVSPLEQHVHSFLEIMPLTAIVLVAILHWSQFLALFGIGPESADFSLRVRQPPLMSGYLRSVLTLVGVVQGALYVEELWRCRRGASGRSRIHPRSAA